MAALQREPKAKIEYITLSERAIHAGESEEERKASKDEKQMQIDKLLHSTWFLFHQKP